jgi:uncharacterized protein
MMNEHSRRLENKKLKLFENLNRWEKVAVAFSGGVDSSLLLAAAAHVLGDQAIAMTAASPTHPAREAQLANEIAKRLGVRHVWFETSEMTDARFTANDSHRCYYCKRLLFGEMRRQAHQLGVETLAHGANIDDMADFRPGREAAEELNVISPLSDAGLGKAEIRQLARQMNLPNWERPSMACLATRIPYGTPINSETLARIDAAEDILWRLGAPFCRVRHHGDLARIEVHPKDVQQIAAAGVRGQVAAQLRQLGYRYVCLDLEGYESGKMNRDLDGASNGPMGNNESTI